MDFLEDSGAASLLKTIGEVAEVCIDVSMPDSSVSAKHSVFNPMIKKIDNII
jgi:hypothetical protein